MPRCPHSPSEYRGEPQSTSRTRHVQSLSQSGFSEPRISPGAEGFDAHGFLMSDEELYVPPTQEFLSYQPQRSQTEEYSSPQPEIVPNPAQVAHGHDNEPIDVGPDAKAGETASQNILAPPSSVTQNPPNPAPSSATNSSSRGKLSPNSDTTTSSNSIDSILGQDFTRFDQLQLMTEFEDDARPQEEFEAGKSKFASFYWLICLIVIEEFNKRMLDLMLEFRVWAECRPIHERDTHGEQLVKEMEEIEAREVSQGNYTKILQTLLHAIPPSWPNRTDPSESRQFLIVDPIRTLCSYSWLIVFEFFSNITTSELAAIR